MTPSPILGAALLGLSGLVLTVALLPSEADRVGLMMRDGTLEPAQALNETLLTRTPGDPVLLRRAFDLRGAAGDVGGATDAAERLFAATGGDMAARRLLAEHYFITGKMQKRADLMLDADPALLTPPERDRLLGELRYTGRFEDERAQLRRMAEAGLLDTDQLGRFGLVLAAGDTPLQAIEPLAAHDDRAEGDSLYLRLTLLHLLIEDNRLDEAARRARRWYALWTDPDAKEAIYDVFDAKGIDWSPD